MDPLRGKYIHIETRSGFGGEAVVATLAAIGTVTNAYAADLNVDSRFWAAAGWLTAGVLANETVRGIRRVVGEVDVQILDREIMLRGGHV